jgi:dihydropteroate synthase
MTTPDHLLLPWRSGDVLLAGDGRPRLMGILNVTPDSFSDGGRAFDPRAAEAAADRLIADGADLLDVGGESSRPGAESITEAEELRRVLPVVEALAGRGVPLSVDTTKAAVARAALAAGARVVNDITAMRGDPAMPRVVADAGAAVVLMHMQGTPRTMQKNPTYADVLTDVYDALASRIDAAVAAGIDRDRIAVDPGIGFGKTLEHNLLLLRGLGRFATLGCAVLIGTSRKGFLGTLTGRDVARRDVASAVSALAAILAGASVARVHDVAAAADALRVWRAQLGLGSEFGWTAPP